MKIASFMTVLLAAAFMAAFAVMPARLCFKGGKNYTFYLGTSSKDCSEYHPAFNAEAERLLVRDVCGESAEYDSLDIDGFLKSVNGKILFEERLDGMVNYYCTADLPYSCTLYGKRINLHICVRENGVKVGSPIIFGGY